MTLSALTWPAASVWIALILGVALVLAVLIWGIFGTGQTAIRFEGRSRDR